MNFTIFFAPLYYLFFVFIDTQNLRNNNSTLYITNNTVSDDDYELDNFNLQWVYNH